MKYILILLFSFTLQAQSLLLLFDDEADSTTTIPAYEWQIDPTLQMFTNATPTLGTDVITNGSFTGSTGWNKFGETLIEDGVAKIISTAGTFTNIAQANKLTINLYYLVFYNVVSSSGAAITSNSFSNGGFTMDASNYLTKKASDTTFDIKRSGVCYNVIDNVSCKPLTNFTPPANVTDYAGSATGTFSDSVESAQPGTNTTGIESGFIFDGVNDFVAVACTTSTTNSTLTAWVKFTTTGAERYIFGTTTGYVRKSDTEVIQASSGTIYLDGQPYGGAAISAGWHLITVTGIALSGTTLNVGASITPGSYLAGFIDRAGRFNGTLSANQVLKLYNDQKSRYGL